LYLLGCIAEGCVRDVVLIDPADREFPVGLNPLEVENEE
jgi:hypothetical protein